MVHCWNVPDKYPTLSATQDVLCVMSSHYSLRPTTNSLFYIVEVLVND